jgi:hypothetical protein
MQLRLCLRQRRAAGEAADDRDAAIAALRQASRAHRLDDEQVEIQAPRQARVVLRPDRNDRRGVAADPDDPADDAGIAAEAALPEAMSDDDGGRDRAVGEAAARQPARGAAQAKDVEVVGADQLGEDAFGLLADRDAARHHARRRDAAQRRCPGGEVDRVGVGGSAIGGAAEVARENRDQAIGGRDRQRLQQKPVDGPEDRGVGADAQRERGDGDEGEGGGPQQEARAEAKVLEA